MPTYKFQCPECGVLYRETLPVTQRDVDLTCDSCPDAPFLERVFSFAYKSPLQEHFNVSTGSYVTSERTLKDEMKRASDERSERLGFDHSFTPVDPRETEALGVTEEGLDSTRRREVEEGKRETKKIVPMKSLRTP